MAAGAVNPARQLGFAFGIAALGIAFAARPTHRPKGDGISDPSAWPRRWPVARPAWSAGSAPSHQLRPTESDQLRTAGSLASRVRSPEAGNVGSPPRASTETVERSGLVTVTECTCAAAGP